MHLAIINPYKKHISLCAVNPHQNRIPAAAVLTEFFNAVISIVQYFI